MARDPAAFPPDELRHVRVLFLGHDGGAGGVGVRQGHEPEFRGGPQHQFLRQAAQMDHDDTGMGQKFQEKIPVAHRVQAVPEDLRKAQLWAALNWGSMGKVVPARAAAPRGETLMRARDSMRRAWSRRHISS